MSLLTSLSKNVGAAGLTAGSVEAAISAAETSENVLIFNLFECNTANFPVDSMGRNFDSIVAVDILRVIPELYDNVDDRRRNKARNEITANCRSLSMDSGTKNDYR